MQNEKRKMLMEHETQKLKELDEEYAKDLREWKAHLKPRKQVRQKLLASIFNILIPILIKQTIIVYSLSNYQS